MRFIPTRIHGMLDYSMGLLLILAPWLLGFDDAANRWAVYVPVGLGISMLVISAMTRYELGLVKAIPMSTHLTIDVIAGLFLAVSPWLFGFADEIAWPHVLFGLLEVGAGLMTQTQPDHLAGYDQSGHARHVTH